MKHRDQDDYWLDTGYRNVDSINYLLLTGEPGRLVRYNYELLHSAPAFFR